jgi:Na+/proline symporter
MSTIATQLNWGASYIVNDFYRRFLRPAAPEWHYVLVSKWATVLVTIVSAVVTFYLNSIAGAWKLLIVTGAGTGLVLLLRWFWWRINAWSEVSAMIAAFATSLSLQIAGGLDSDKPVDFAWIMIITVAVTTVVWLSVTFLTKPEADHTLVKFYVRARPSGAGWRRVAAISGAGASGWQQASMWYSALDWLSGCALIYGVLFGTGKLLLGEWPAGFLLLGIGLAGGSVIWWDLSRRGWSSVVE